MIRDPLNVIPSGLSLVTGVLDKRFGFWSLENNIRAKYINRLYNALIILLKRFHDDWVNDRIDKSRVMVVRYDRMMSDFETLMDDIFLFTNHEPSTELIDEIKNTNEALQRETTAIQTYWKDSLYEVWKAKVNRKYRIQLKKIQID